MGDRRDSHDRARETVEVDAGADRSAATDDTELGWLCCLRSPTA
jgi:hypothetical protein